MKDLFSRKMRQHFLTALLFILALAAAVLFIMPRC